MMIAKTVEEGSSLVHTDFVSIITDQYILNVIY